jgi:hypothetical protein
MKYYQLQPLSVEQFLALPRPKPSKTFYHETVRFAGKTLGTLDIASRGISIVLSRDVRANVRHAADMAAAIAHADRKRCVFYINTFAGTAMVQQAIKAGMMKAGLRAPLPLPLHGDETFWPDFDERQNGADKNSCKKEQYTRRQERQRDHVYQRTKLERDLQARHCYEEAQNLTVYDVPMGDWLREQAINRLRAVVDAAIARPQNIKLGLHSPVFIVNAFEFAALTSSEKWRIARELIALQQQYDAAVILCSQEIRQELKRGFAGRGPIGMLCAIAERVCRIADPHEELIRKRNVAHASACAFRSEEEAQAEACATKACATQNRSNQPEINTIHEAQTQTGFKRLVGFDPRPAE